MSHNNDQQKRIKDKSYTEMLEAGHKKQSNISTIKPDSNKHSQKTDHKCRLTDSKQAKRHTQDVEEHAKSVH